MDEGVRARSNPSSLRRIEPLVTKKLTTILGTRPEIVKFSPLLPRFDERFEHVLIHTGQHYDENMDAVFFDELRLARPRHSLRVGSAGGPGAQTGRMLERLEPLLIEERPAWVVVLGDTNSTLAGALVAAKLGIPVAHVEAGCRSFNRTTPEEQNRVVVDHLADVLFAPDADAVHHLRAEGIAEGRIHEVGNTGLDATRRTMAFAGPERLERFGVTPDAFVVATVHRAENTDDAVRLASLMNALAEIARRIPLLFPMHPRTSAALTRHGIALSPEIRMLPPLGNLDFLALLRFGMFSLSDSGGVQEEAAVVNRPCLILRGETEWIRLVDAGKNILAGTQTAAIVGAANRLIDSADIRETIRRKPAPLNFGATDRVVAFLEG